MHRNQGSGSSGVFFSMSSLMNDKAHSHNVGKPTCPEAVSVRLYAVANDVYSFATVLAQEQTWFPRQARERESRSTLDGAAHDWRYCGSAADYADAEGA